MITNRTGSLFGPAGMTAGVIVVVFGFSVMFSWTGILLIVIGLFFGLSVTGCEINQEKRLFRAYTSLFGIIRVGDWQSIDNFTHLQLGPNKNVYNTFSRGNRLNSASAKGMLIYLINTDNYHREVVCRCKNREDAEKEIKKLSNILNKPIFKSE